MIPQTGHEAAGGSRWTTRTEETELLQRMADETPLQLDVAGLSVQGNPVWRASIGSGSTVMVVANVHGNEPSGRDAALSWMRDLAYDVAPGAQDYLASHRVVVIPNLNVDGSNRPRLRENANGADLNRDYMSLRQPETRAVARTVQDVRPVVILDMHEVGDDEGHIWRPWWDAPPGAHPDLLELAEGLHDYTVDQLAQYGTSSPYATSLVPWGGLSTIAGAWHAVGILSEVAWRTTTLPLRHEINYAVLESLREFHQEHRSDLDAARSASEAYISADPIRVPTHVRLNQGSVVTVPADSEYAIDGDIPQELYDLHGIQASGSTVSLQQPGRLMAAYLCAPESSEQVQNAADWAPEPEGSQPLQAATQSPVARVKHQGAVYPASSVWVKDAGSLRPVDKGMVKHGGALHSL